MSFKDSEARVFAGISGTTLRFTRTLTFHLQCIPIGDISIPSTPQKTGMDAILID